MTEAEALSEIRCCYRDFLQWMDAPVGIYQEGANLDEQVDMIRFLFTAVYDRDKHAWRKGSFKREDLDTALATLGLPLLGME